MINELAPPVGFRSAIDVAIIYEDFASGARAKHFAERLAEGLGCQCALSESLWRSALLECPPIAEEAARVVAGCDYLIVSMSGECTLPLTTLRWLETQLNGAAGRGMGLIALGASHGDRWNTGECARRHLRWLCTAKGVPFFSHSVSPSTADVREWELEAEIVLPPRSQALLEA